jgi:two-component system response regulator RegX3
MTRILLVEDQESLSEPLAILLERDGYETVIANDGQKALNEFAKGGFDIILLDLMLPVISGMDVCREVRKTSSIPIIMLTAKDTEVDIVVGLELGADDYVTKPYRSSELLARIKAAVRRKVVEADTHDSDSLTVGRISMDVERHKVTVDGASVSMPLKEFDLLEYFLRNPGRVLTRGQLIDRVWGSDYFGDTKTLDVHIKRVRAKIEVDPKEPVILTTVRGLGYRLENI